MSLGDKLPEFESLNYYVLALQIWPRYYISLVLSFIVCMLNHVRLFATLWTVPTRLLCLWAFPRKNAGVSCHFIF